MKQVFYAYHVTNIESTSPKPNWASLSKSKAEDSYFDDVLYDRDCVFLSTTLYQGRLPTKSVYPTDGESDERYWRVRIPLERFNNHRIRLCNEKSGQIHLVLCKEDNDWEFMMCEDVTNKKATGYLYRDNENKWFCNDYGDQQTRYFVNIAVLEDLDIRGCFWDTVQKL